MVLQSSFRPKFPEFKALLYGTEVVVERDTFTVSKVIDSQEVCKFKKEIY
jgi:hypothetical protein